MDLEFDKEIDLLLRQTAQGKTASAIQNSQTAHLDSDELAAFAENALPEKAKQLYLLHLADCDDCRKSLSNLILLNSNEPEKIVSVEEKTLIQTTIPWYRKLFAVTNLAYSMGALVLIFSGIVVYTVLQNSGSQPNSEVSQTYEKQPNGKGMSSDGDAATTETFSANTMMSNAASMNTSANTSTNSALNSSVAAAPMSAANANSPIPRKETENILKEDSKVISPKERSVENQNLAMSAPPPPPLPQNNFQADGAVTDLSVSKRSVPQNQSNNLPAGSVKTAPKPALSSEAAKSKKLEMEDDRDEIKSAETTRVGGKTFERKNNVWYDSAYRGQATTNVRRGSEEYKKLDANLRGIAENLNGTVVVVGREKAYRIQ